MINAINYVFVTDNHILQKTCKWMEVQKRTFTQNKKGRGGPSVRSNHPFWNFLGFGLLVVGEWFHLGQDQTSFYQISIFLIKSSSFWWKLIQINCMVWPSVLSSMIMRTYYLRIFIVMIVTIRYFSLSSSDFVEWAPGRPVFKHATKDRLAMMRMIMMVMIIMVKISNDQDLSSRYIFWNAGGLGWSIGKLEYLTSGSHWHRWEKFS